MNRSTPAKLARAERLERASPYARPAESKVKRSSSMISFPGLRSLVSYMTYPFSRSPSQKGLPLTNSDVAADQKSESGSEDGWNGEPSSSMQGKDVFDLASAGGRDGPEFESRADKWRARGENAGGRRELARKSLENANIADPPLKSPIMPGHLPSSLRPSPAMPSLGESSTPSFGTAVSSITNNLKRRLSPTKPAKPLPPRSPLPAFAPAPPPVTPAAPASSSRLPAHTTSASSVALKAFLDAKDGQPLSNEDLRVIESLTESARHESEAGSIRNEPQVGGWAAGNFTPRNIRPLPSTTTPNRQNGSAFGTPGSGFNLGVSTPRTSTPGRLDSPGSVRYIGPGWSARRIYPQKKSGLKPLFSFNAEEEGIAKKRKVDSFEAMDDDIPPVPPLPSLAASKSMPNLASSSRSPAPKSPVKKAASPVKSVEDAVAIGKRRAADIMLDLINSEILPKEKEIQPFIVNPYHPDAQSVITNKPSPSVTPASPLRNGTPRKSILKLSTNNQTPLRGAAKRLEEAKHTAPSPSRMTTLEMLTGRHGVEKEEKGKGKQGGKAVRIETPETEDEPSEVEDMVETPSAERRTFMGDEQQKRLTAESGPSSGSPPKRTKLTASEPEPVKPFTAPQLSSSTLPVPSSPTSSFTFTPIASSSNSDGLRPTPQPKFTPSPLSKSIMPEEPKFSLGSFDPSPSPQAIKKTGIYLTAKDTALAIAKEALPFFTFTFSMPTSAAKDSDNIKKAKEEAMKRPLNAEFHFVLHPPTPAKTSMPPPPVPASTSAKPWTCDLCMLQNPASATEKCTICEARKPTTSAPASGPKPFNPFAVPPPPSASTPSTSSGPWTCSLCMLQNPGTATEKCTICEAPKPATAAAAPKPFSFSSTATPSATSTMGTTQNKGFDWAAAGGKKPDSGKAGKWTCGTCMLDNPDSAKEKCTVCEAPRP